MNNILRDFIDATITGAMQSSGSVASGRVTQTRHHEFVSQTTQVTSKQVISSFNATKSTGLHCISYVTSFAAGGSGVENTQASLSIHSGDGKDEIPDGFSWDAEGGRLTISPTTTSAISAAIFLRKIEDLVVVVEDGCDLNFSNKASQSALRLSIESNKSNINLHGGQSSHALKIRTASGYVAVGDRSSSVTAKEIDVKNSNGDTSACLECNDVTVKSINGDISSDIQLNDCSGAGNIRSSTIYGSVSMLVGADRPLQLHSHHTSIHGNIRLEHHLRREIGWDLTTSWGKVMVNGKSNGQRFYQPRDAALGSVTAHTDMGDIYCRAGDAAKNAAYGLPSLTI